MSGTFVESATFDKGFDKVRDKGPESVRLGQALIRLAFSCTHVMMPAGLCARSQNQNRDRPQFTTLQMQS
ncbi:hypothetical protein SBV1_370113 [Verrucomicrobia bacterium]|nr:hypothetical protein SBV1_370113 [Verrucomicrobiota bacterium]